MNILDLAKAEIGTLEWAQGDNPKVVAYYRDAGHPEVKHDSVAWCAAFVGAMLKRAGYAPSGSLLARSYLEWGKAVDPANAQPDDIGIVPRGASWQGHVFIIEKVVGKTVHAIGGNQSDSVSRAKFPLSSLIGCRRAIAPNSIPAPRPANRAPRPSPYGGIDKPPVSPKPVVDTKPPVQSRQNWIATIIAAIVALFRSKK